MRSSNSRALSMLAKTIIILSLFVMTIIIPFNLRVYAQNGPVLECYRVYGGSGNDLPLAVVQTQDEGFAFAGYTSSYGAGEEDMWLVKTGVTGNKFWSQSYGGTSIDKAYALILTRDGGFALAGYTSSYGAGENDMWLVKTDEYGIIQWNHTYGGLGEDNAYDLLQTRDGGYALAGHTNSYGTGGGDMWLVKTDSSGNLQWHQTYGGIEFEEARTLIQTKEGNYVLAGCTKSDGSEEEDIWLVKTDMNGTLEWHQTYGGTSGNEKAWALLETKDGGYALTGDNQSFSKRDIIFVKTDENGGIEWTQTGQESKINFGDSSRGLIQLKDGTYMIAGTIYPYDVLEAEMWLVHLNETGAIQWTKKYAGLGSDHCQAVLLARDGSFVLTGDTRLSKANELDALLIKTQANPDFAEVENNNAINTIFGGLLFCGIIIVLGILVNCQWRKKDDLRP